MNISGRRKQYHETAIAIASLFSIALIAVFLLSFIATAVSSSNQMFEKRFAQRSFEALEESGRTLCLELNEIANSVAKDTYDELILELSENDNDMSEEDALALYRAGFCDNLSEEITLERLSDISLYFSEESGARVYVDSSLIPTVVPVRNIHSHDITQITLTNVRLRFAYDDEHTRAMDVEYDFSLPTARFFNGNDEILSYSLIAGKGLYITGRTSSIVGNVYAGTHTGFESRKAEASYGERGTYGGINVLSTQVGVIADKVISAGDINLKGSFVVFGSDDTPTRVYASKINCLRDYLKKSDYGMYGGDLESPDDESIIGIRAMLDEVVGDAAKLADSDEEGEADEAWQTEDVFISDGDVMLKEDFTGILISAGNVIIDKDINIEGLVIAGDRIYIQGNNNIVSGRGIVRRLLNDTLLDTISDFERAGCQDTGNVNVRIKEAVF